MKKIFLFLFLILINFNVLADIVIGNDTGVTTKVFGRELCERAVKKGVKVKDIIISVVFLWW